MSRMARALGVLLVLAIAAAGCATTVQELGWGLAGDVL